MRFLNIKKFYKKINSKININFDEKKKFNQGLLNNLNISFDLAYGKIFC